MQDLEVKNNRLKKIRMSYNLTVRDLSDALNINRVTLTQIENNKTRLNDLYIHLICDYFKISADYLLGRSDIANLPTETIVKKNKDTFIFTQNNNDMFPSILKNDVIVAQSKIALKINDLVAYNNQAYRLICISPIILKKDNITTNEILSLNTLQKVSKIIKITRHLV